MVQLTESVANILDLLHILLPDKTTIFRESVIDCSLSRMALS